MKLSANIRKWICQLTIIMLTESVKYSLCSYAIMTFLVIIITVTFSDEDKHLIQFYRKNRALRSTSYNQNLSRKEMNIKLNAAHYKISGIMQDRVYASTVLAELKQRISDEWNEIDQQLISGVNVLQPVFLHQSAT